MIFPLGASGVSVFFLTSRNRMVVSVSMIRWHSQGQHVKSIVWGAYKDFIAATAPGNACNLF